MNIFRSIYTKRNEAAEEVREVQHREQRANDLDNVAQRAESMHRLAQLSIKEGNGRVIAMLNEALGRGYH